MKKLLSILIALIMIFSMAGVITAFAAEEKKLTYAERITKLKTDYNVVYKFDKNLLTPYYSQSDVNKILSTSLAGTELALERIGASAFKKLSKNYSQYSISFEELTGNIFAYGNHSAGRVKINPDMIDLHNFYQKQIDSDAARGFIFDLTDQDDFKTSFKSMIAILVAHELGHEYDDNYLKGAGANIIKQVKKDNNIPKNYTENGFKYYRSVTSSALDPARSALNSSINLKGADEDFAQLFAWMLIQDGKITDWLYTKDGGTRYNIDKSDPTYKACEAILNQMIKDFGPDSAGVKRAAKFLGKTLPKTK